MKREERAERQQRLSKWRKKGFTTASGPTPEIIRHVRAIKRFDGVMACHVYFLLHEGEVVYVGQSGAGWPSRVHSHLRDKAKVFDDIWYIEVDRPTLSDVERRFIEEFNPKYNKHGRLR